MTDFDIACQRLNGLASDRRTPQAVSGDLSLVLLTAVKVAWIEKEVENRGAEIDRLRAAIILHRSQRADDRCIEDDDRLYEALGDGIKCDRRVGDKDAMLENCRRFIENRCEAGGPWKSYAELENEMGQLLAQVAAMRAALLDVQDLMQRKSRWDNEDLEYDRRISCALDGTAANAITAEWDQLRERVAELERMVAGLERGAERASHT